MVVSFTSAVCDGSLIYVEKISFLSKKTCFFFNKKVLFYYEVSVFFTMFAKIQHFGQVVPPLCVAIELSDMRGLECII